jgi:DNA primase catalytic subunit
MGENIERKDTIEGIKKRVKQKAYKIRIKGDNMNYDHEKVLEENTREQTPAELKKLRIFAASLLVFLFSTVFFITEYSPVTTKHNMYSNYRVSSQEVDNYDNTLEYYKF